MDKTRITPSGSELEIAIHPTIGSVRTDRCDWRTHRTFRRQQHV